VVLLTAFKDFYTKVLGPNLIDFSSSLNPLASATVPLCALRWSGRDHSADPGFTASLRANKSEGLLYDSVRRPEYECLTALRPIALHAPVHFAAVPDTEQTHRS